MGRFEKFHGDICCDDRVVATWSAVPRPLPVAGVVTYDCHLLAGAAGHWFTLPVPPGMGPMEILSRILDEVSRSEKEKEHG